MSTTKDIADWLEDRSTLALAFKDDLHVAAMPDSPDECVMVGYSPGAEPEPGCLIRRPGVTVMVRGAVDGYAAAEARTVAILEILDGQHNLEINGIRYISIHANSDVNFIGYDPKSRPIFAVTFRLEQTTA